jgi:KDO2-lipid IV(A) lauroyltransferase
MNSFAEACFKLLSRLPLGALYVFADVAFLVVYYIAGYRRGVVRKNLQRSFPEKTQKELRRIEKDFFHFLCDYAVETIKLLTISEEEMRRRMTFEGVEEMEAELEKHPFVFVYLGHYCNWEWVSSLPMWMKKETTHCAQIYRPLKNKAFDALFMQMRTRFHAENISKYDTLRRVLSLKQEGRPTIIGFISDQSPRWQSIHEWVDFLHQETPVFTGTERIGKKVNAAIFFLDMKRTSRGHYCGTFKPITDAPKSYPDFQISEICTRELEAMIRRQPAYWLWSHKRWKHKRQ